MVRPSGELVAGFVFLTAVLSTGFVAAAAATERRRGARFLEGARAALGVFTWLGVTGVAAAVGVLSFERQPPGLMLLVPVMLIGVVLLSRSPTGRRIALGVPLPLLVGWQGFRLPLELLMHRAYREGLMPVQMSFEGLNFDILTGASALLLAALLAVGRAPRGLVWAWNTAGLLLLANIIVVSLLSTPTPLRVFPDPPANVWVAQFPFVWLPTVMVATALLGHLLIYRRLRADRTAAPAAPARAAAREVTAIR